jgi:hypothetical protein
MSAYRFAIDGAGAPILLDAEAETATVDPPVKPDPATGSIARRRDAVVHAARSIDDLTPAGVEAFVRRCWRGDRAIAQEDIDSFAKDAREHRAHDVVDALDHRIRRGVNGRSRTTHVSIPRGKVGKSLASLDGDGLTSVVSRLRDRGWTNEQIWRHGVRRFDKDGRMRDQIMGNT